MVRIMKKGLGFGIVLALVAVVFVAVPMNVSAAGEYSSYFAGGTGTAEDPYQISNVNELQNMNLDLSAHYILVNDIDASSTSSWNGGAGFEPIGTVSNRFTGTFDGFGYKITGLYINRASKPYTHYYFGLFGSTDHSKIKNVGLEDVNVTGDGAVGGLVGHIKYTSISNCYSTGSVSGNNWVGGLVGENHYGASISNCYSTCSVSGTGYCTGGLVGWTYGGSISNSYSTGSVSGNYQVGGLAGFIKGSISNSYSTGSVKGYISGAGGLAGWIKGSISNSYSTGSVDGNNQVGGLVGENHGPVSSSYSTGSVRGNNKVGGLAGWNKGSISNSYSTGSVSGNNQVGGLVGYMAFYSNSGGSISNSYSTSSVDGEGGVGGLVGLNVYGRPVSNSFWDTEMSCQSSSNGGTGKTTAEMLTKSTYTDVGWDFTNIWNIVDGVTYPYFRWQNVVHLTSSNLIETSSMESFLVETLLVQKGNLNNVLVTGDLNGNLNFNSFEIINIQSGSFAGKGFSKGEWQANLEGANYEGKWQGMFFLKPAENRIYLKGTISGEISGIVEGDLTEYIPNSNVYDQYCATWRLNHIGTQTVSATIYLNGTIDYQENIEYPSTEIYVVQTHIEGSPSGYYTGPLSTVLTHIRVADEANPYYGEGFSVISYISDLGQGEGWTYNKLDTLNVIEMIGLFTDPLLGIISGGLVEDGPSRSLYILIERIDIGLPPAPDLKIEMWGPGRVSPGQTINYIIEYRNDGLKKADEVLIFCQLDPLHEFISASSGANYDEFFNTVSWNVGKMASKSKGELSITCKIPWGLSQGTRIGASAYITNIQRPSGSPNLFLNGIGLEFNTPHADKYEGFAQENNADWIPVYYSGIKVLTVPVIDVLHVAKATPNGLYITFEATDYNGLTHPRIIDWNYNTVYAYSGGTRTTITAIKNYNLRANNIVLISPMSGLEAVQGVYKLELEYLLIYGLVKEIYIYQSNNDILPVGGLYQAKFYPATDNWFEKIINTPDGPKKIGDMVFINSQKLPDGKIIKNIEKINTKDHWNLFRFINELGDEKTSSEHVSEIIGAHDPNIKYGPDGNVTPGQTLDYTVEFENEGEGIAFGVYFTDTLDEDLDDSTLVIGPVYDVETDEQIADPGIYNPGTRTIIWLVGEVGPGEGGYANFSVNVRSDAPDGTEIINYATVHFPSVPEVTRTNGIVSIVRLNQPPVAEAGGPYTGVEGTEITFDASASSDPDGDELQYRWDFDNDGIWDTEYSTEPTVTYTWYDDYTGEVVVEVYDSEYTDMDTTAVMVNNVAPIVDAGLDAIINEGDTFTRLGLFEDPGYDTWTATINFGDGSEPQLLTLNPDKSFSLSHVYADNGVYTVIVTVTDDDGGEGNDTLEVSVNNIAPTASIDNVIQPFPDFILPTDVLEFYGSFIDPGTLDTHTIEWDFGDGTIITGTLTPTHAYTESGVYTVTLTVTDDDGGVGIASVEIIVESPAEATQEVLEDIEEMELQYGMNESLSSKLENAIKSMDNGQYNAAANQLNAFINQVEAQRGKKLTEEQADALIAAAQWIIDNINANGS